MRGRCLLMLLLLLLLPGIGDSDLECTLGLHRCGESFFKQSDCLLLEGGLGRGGGL